MRIIAIILLLFSFTAQAQTKVTLRAGITDTASLSNRINKKVDSVRRRAGTDTVEQLINGQWLYAFKDSSGGVLPTRNLTLSGGTGIDVTGGTQDLSADRTWTVDADTLLMSTRAWRQKGDDSLAVIINTKMSADSIAIRRAGTNLIHYLSRNSSYNGTVGISGAGIAQDSANLMIGLRTGASSTTGYRNIAIGRAALKGVTTGFSNLAIGDSAFSTSTITGSFNTSIGAFTGRGLTSGTYNTVVGYGTNPISSGIGNLIFGGNNWTTVPATITGGANIILGYRLAESLTSGSGNILIGGADNISGAFPDKTANGLTTENYNIIVGHGAAVSLKGTKNVIMGTNAGKNINGTTNDNVFIGYNSGGELGPSAVSPTSATTAIGYNAMGSQTIGTGNTAIGYRAGARVIGPSNYNTFVGYSAGDYSGADTSVGNTLVGYDLRLYHAGKPENNTFVGVLSNYTTAGIQGDRNVFLGNTDLAFINISGTDNVKIGANVGIMSNSLSSQFTLGANAIRWLISDLDGSHRRWTLNGTNTTISSNTTSVTLDITGTLGGVRFPLLTETQRNALTATDGLMIYCTDCLDSGGVNAGVLQVYQLSTTTWKNVY